jgi:hypothetical protein
MSVTTAAPAKIDDATIDAFRDVPLLPHSAGEAGAVHSLSVSGVLRRSGSLRVEFQLAAELRAIRLVPSVCQPHRRDELWRHTCFEVFVRCGSGPRYCEFNISPSGDWAAYQFDRYRSARADAKQDPIDISVQTSGLQQISLRARIDLQAAFAGTADTLASAVWHLNCAAVIEFIDGSLGYWAVHHPRPKPDFHDAEGFQIALRDSNAGRRAEPTPP